MPSLYIHIPFCKQACHYCDFYFSTSLKYKQDLIQALVTELNLRKNELLLPLDTIYFGGGTPSLLTIDEIQGLIEAIYQAFSVNPKAEITLEVNPDDLTSEFLYQLSQTKINRLSIGVQSFFDKDLVLMNRAHQAFEALSCVKEATRYFDNITIDLIYGIPGMSIERWHENLDIALDLNIPHISAYALTVEPKTALKKFIETGKIPPVSDELSHSHYTHLIQKMSDAGYINYEFSNFGKPGFFSRNNTAYWTGKKYVGIGPSAHSFNGKQRSWNISNNIKYIKSIQNNILPSETETLSTTDRYNEYIMTGLRTMWGVRLEKIEREFGDKYLVHLLKQVKKPFLEGKIEVSDNILHITQAGKFLGDRIASELFFEN